MKTYSGDNPSQLYIDALIDLMAEGKDVAPRGKKTKELRPVAVGFTKPTNRVTFVRGRRINPFFQLAESFWILAGRSDVKWLTHYNANMAQFSDDGETFNAPYGERLRFWNKNDYRGFVFNPIDQLVDVYEKLKKDTDTRQAVATIYNPVFDNISYGGKDFPCNLILTFKIRDNKLELTVFNRGNDAIYGLWGANLAQFSTIQEVVASWLGIEVGSYHQITDSLHTYTEDYGYKETENIMKANGIDINSLSPENKPTVSVEQFSFEDEPRISANYGQFQSMLNVFFNGWLSDLLHDDTALTENPELFQKILDTIDVLPDAYFRNTIFAMTAYRAHKLGVEEYVFKALDKMADSSWKVSCLFFLYPKYKNNSVFVTLYEHYDEDKKRYIENKPKRAY